MQNYEKTRGLARGLAILFRVRFLATPLLFALGLTPLCAQDHSLYVPMKDGTRLAVDVYLPEEAGTHPVLFELTRYWRSRQSARDGQPIPALSGLDRAFLSRGYALVKVDVRGSGASFGVRNAEYGRQEVRDGYDLVEWAVGQPWCDGNVGAFGTSYTGTTAELLAASGHPAVKAVIPGWSDFDLYTSPARPYGLLASVVVQWGEFVARLDANDPSLMGASVRPVNEDPTGELLALAVDAHAANLDVGRAVRASEFRDDVLREGADSYQQMSPMYWRREIEDSGVPMLVFASWLDAGTAGGALQRLQMFSNPQKLVILGSGHGGQAHASPFVVRDRPLPPVPDLGEQVGMRIDFFDHHLRGDENGVEAWPVVRYFNLGEERFLESDTWPPTEVSMRRYHFREGGALSAAGPGSGEGSDGARDSYTVDFGVSTGTASRWATQLGTPVLGLGDRGAMDERMLTYTTEPLAEALQMTGAAVVRLRITSNTSDAALLVYLEDVDPAGRSRYVTEGGLRALHRRKTSPEGVRFPTYLRADALPLVPGEEAELVFELWSTSVRFEKGHRVRIALAGADADNFDRVPSGAVPTFEVSRSVASPSSIELPVVEAR